MSLLAGYVFNLHSKQEIAEKVPDISVRTVELVLGQLQKKGEIKKIGSFRDARYMRI